MQKITLSYEDVSEFYSYLIRSGATEYTKSLNDLKHEGIQHGLSIQLFNRILDHKYNNKASKEENVEQFRASLQDERNESEIKQLIFKYYVQMLNSFKDEPSNIKAIAKNTGLSEAVVHAFLAKNNEQLGLKYKDKELEQNIRPIFAKIWG